MSTITKEGCEISNQKGTTVTYKLKCDCCGFIDNSEATITMMRGVTEITSKKCPNCGKIQVIKMKIDLN